MGLYVGYALGNVDVAPTILAVLGLAADGEIAAGAGFDRVDGRVLREALEGGPDEEQIAVETRVHTVEAGAYRAGLQVSMVDGCRYVDKSSRIT